MIEVNPQYITDTSGKKLSVILTIKDYEAILEKLEELEDIELSTEMKSVLDERILEDESTYLSAEESIKQLNKKYDL